MTNEHLHRQCRDRIASGASREEVLAYLYEVHISSPDKQPKPLEAVSLIRQLYALDLHAAVIVLQEDSHWSAYHVVAVER